MELDILKILATDKIKYYKYRKFIGDVLVSKYTKKILEDYNVYYREFGSKSIDLDNFPTWFFTTRHPKISMEDKEIYDKMLLALKSHKVDTSLENEIIKGFITRDSAALIADEAMRISEGESLDMGKVRKLYREWEHNTGKAAEIDSRFVSDDIEEILSSTIGPSGLDWRLKFLNDSLGPIRKGDFILFGKRPDSGGTTLMASEATFMAPQLPEDKYVLWVNNEEKGESVKLRLIQAALGETAEYIEKNRKDAMADYIKIVGEGKIKVFDDAKASIYDVEELLSREDVGLLIVDQLRKLKGLEHIKGDVQRDEGIFNTGREWAKAYCPVMVVHQADGTAEGQQWISQNQLYGSKTAVQGELDAIITIGRTLDPSTADRRYIWVPKNKLCGGPKSDPLMRNGRAEVKIVPEKARFKMI